MDFEQNHLGTGRMSLGLAMGAVAGLVSYVVLELSVPVAMVTLAYGWEERQGAQILHSALLSLIFGLPLALLLSMAIGRPIWKRAESRALRSRHDALIYGAAAGASIGFLFLLLGFLIGLRTFFDANTSYNSWMYGHQVTRDGLPTLLGWLFELLTVLYFTLAGAIGGLVARWTAFPRAMRQ